jgi:hypothetical protein
MVKLSMVFLLLLIFVAFAVAITPQFNVALNVAKTSWPTGSFMLNLIPTPVGFALTVLVGLLILLIAYLAAQSAQ